MVSHSLSRTPEKKESESKFLKKGQICVLFIYIIPLKCALVTAMRKFVHPLALACKKTIEITCSVTQLIISYTFLIVRDKSGLIRFRFNYVF